MYVRVSRYDENAHQISPEAQLERCKALPSLADFNVETFQDVDISGKNTKRPGLSSECSRACATATSG